MNLADSTVDKMIRVGESGSQKGVAKEKQLTLPSHEDTGIKVEALVMTRD